MSITYEKLEELREKLDKKEEELVKDKVPDGHAVSALCPRLIDRESRQAHLLIPLPVCSDGTCSSPTRPLMHLSAKPFCSSSSLVS